MKRQPINLLTGTVALGAVLAGFQAVRKPPAVKSESPVILIYWQRGFSFEPPAHVLEFAAFKSGRVLWRDAPFEWEKIGGKWQSSKGRHWEGKVDPGRIRDAIAKIERGDTFSIKRWHFLPPDSSSRRIEIRDGVRELTLESAEEPPLEVPHNREPKFYNRGVKAWRLIRVLARELTPKTGRPIPPPDISKWFSPIGIPQSPPG